MIEIHDGEFVRVEVPAYLARSLRLALRGVHAPFFTQPDDGAVVAVLRREEWARLAPRFAAARAAGGFRLVSIRPMRPDGEFLARLGGALAAAGAVARLLPSFHHDYLLVAGDELERTVEAIRHFLDSEHAPGERGGQAPRT